MSVSDFTELKLLAAVFNNVSYVVAGTFIKLHIGNPGENATANAAAHTTRVAAAWNAAAAGAVSNSGAVTFTPLAATETITHISVWDNISAGNALWYGALATPQNVNTGGTLNFAIGAITATLD